LKEILEAESTNIVGVEEPQKAGDLVLTDAIGTLLSEEARDFVSAYCQAGVAVKPLEG